MANNLENLAARLEGDPFFLACPLKHFAQSEGLNEEMLASYLRCSDEALLSIRLCRAPAAESEAFHDEIDRIASRFSVNAGLLVEAVRRGQAIFQMTQDGETRSTLLAARDGDAEHGPEDKAKDNW